MSTTAGRVFSGVTRLSFSRGMFVRNATTTVRRLDSVRSLALSAQMSAKSKRPTDEEEELDEPLKFTTSQASHRTWKVDRSMGSHYERPWWKVFPISVAVSGFLLWCALRDETDVDVQLEKQLFGNLPGLLSAEEEEEEE
ncbi:ubiquinol-cytochrome c reductase complex assembly factor 4 [Stegastes partitus]|uniref:Protein CCSMST1 n=1 Tax=Stegastes partitus TaxID=144197 RepID=A0A3B5B7A4_9TELE|nr:PREDICTED: protein CCSMST1 [Stegastes partitus]